MKEILKLFEKLAGGIYLEVFFGVILIVLLLFDKNIQNRVMYQIDLFFAIGVIILMPLFSMIQEKKIILPFIFGLVVLIGLIICYVGFYMLTPVLIWQYPITHIQYTWAKVMMGILTVFTILILACILFFLFAGFRSLKSG